MDPLVTVIVSSYNRPVLLRDALDSVIEQTYDEIEVLIADDYSDAPARKVIDEYVGLYGAWMKLVRPKSPPASTEERRWGSRCAVSINAALYEARGKYVCYLPDDDFMTPNSVAARVNFLEQTGHFIVYGKLRSCISPSPVRGRHYEATAHCQHDDAFWRAEPIGTAANRVGHGMFMHARPSSYPYWPVMRLERTVGEVGKVGEVFDCPDAGFLYLVEGSGLGPFYSIPDVVVVKRYHVMGHRKDPTRRE